MGGIGGMCEFVETWVVSSSSTYSGKYSSLSMPVGEKRDPVTTIGSEAMPLGSEVCYRFDSGMSGSNLS